MDLVTPAVAGAAGALVIQLSQKGADWLIHLVAAHSPAVQAKARANAENFLERLARRVERLEAELPVAQRGVFTEALEHPSTSFLVQRAFTSAATTDNDDRHAILSELIAQRLTADADDMVALTGSAACDIVSALSSRQIHLLGVMSLLIHIRPAQPIGPMDQNAYDEAVGAWWDFSCKNLCTQDLMKVNVLDFKHLVSLSCIWVMHLTPQNLQTLLSLPSASGKLKVSMGTMEAMPWWPIFRHVWETGVEYAHITTTGTLIGTLHCDQISGTRTQINW